MRTRFLTMLAVRIDTDGGTSDVVEGLNRHAISERRRAHLEELGSENSAFDDFSGILSDAGTNFVSWAS